MMNTRTANILNLLISLCVTFVLFSACSFRISQKTDPAPTPVLGTVKVGISLDENFSWSSSSERSAMPSGFPTDDATKLVFGGAIHADGTTVTADMLTEGVYSYDSANKTSAVDIPFTILNTDRTSGYSITIYAFPHGTTLSSSTLISSAFLVGKTAISIPASSSAVTLSDDAIKMYPNVDNTTAKGFVNLSVTIPSKYYLAADNSGLKLTRADSAVGDTITYTIENKESGGISASSPMVTFSLLQTDGVETWAVYAWSEAINIFPGLTTNKWDVNSIGTLSADGTTRIISEITISSTVYVRGSVETGQTSWFESFGSADGDDSGIGSLMHPFATVQKAVDKVLAMNGGADGESYTIFVDGTVTTTENSSSLVTIKYLTQPLNLKISGIGSDRAILSGGMNPRDDSNARVIQVAPENDSASKINKKIDLTLANLIIQNGGGLPKLGDGAWTSGGGIFVNCETTANIVLDNVQVKDCTALWGGGALFSGACNVVLQNNTVFGDLSFHTNETTATESNCSNLATGNGAGFTAQGDKVNVTIKNGCYVTGNYLKRNSEGGGGILYRTSDASTKLTLEEGAFVSYNATSETVGGGIFIEKNSSSSSLAVISGSIIGNKAGTKGNGIYCDDKITLSGAAKIDSNNDIYLPSGKVVTIADNLTKSGTVARISLDSSQYAVGTKVLQAATEALITNNIGKFILNAPNAPTTDYKDFYLTPDSTGKNAMLAKPNLGVSVGLAVGEYTFKVLKNGKESGTDSISTEDVLSFKVYNSSNAEVTNAANYKIAVKQNGDEIPGLKAESTTANTATVTIPKKLADIGGVVDVFVSAKIDGVTYDASVCGIRVTKYAEVAVGDLKSYLKTRTGQVAVSMKADTAEDIVAIKEALRDSNVTATGVDLELTGGVTSIGESAFYGCKKLTSVTIPDSVTSIGKDAFYWCTSLTSVEIPSSVTSIGKSAFYSCSSLTSVEIPSSVTSIGGSAFTGCGSLTLFIVDEGNQKYASENGVWFNKDKTTLIRYPARKMEVSYSIPSSVTSIDGSAFEYCGSLTSVEIPSSVTSIGGYAFYWCTSLTSVEIPSSVTSIGENAFISCSSLTSVKFLDITNWYVDSSSTLSYKTAIDVTNESTNATNFKSSGGAWYDKYLHKKP